MDGPAVLSVWHPLKSSGLLLLSLLPPQLKGENKKQGTAVFKEPARS